MSYTRQQYLDKECTHRQFYGQFVTPGIIREVEDRIGVSRLYDSQDPHFNDIPLGRWDGLGVWLQGVAAKKILATGDVPTLAGGVCIAKEAARQILDRAKARD